MKKPGVLGRGLPGRQQLGATKVAYRNYTKQPRAPHLPSPEEFYEAEIDKFSVTSGSFAWGCCPFHADRNPSLCMHLESGWYQCKSSSCGATGKSIVRFVCERDGLSVADAIRYLENWL